MPGAVFAPWRKRRRSIGPIVPTAPAAPDTPSTPSPADTATAYYTLLSWVSARATKFDIYLDTVNPPATIVVPKYNTTSYVPTLAPATRYYWKIVAFNDGGSATGPVWSFTTPTATAVLFSLAGAIVTSNARFGSLSIHDVLGSSPNTGSVTFDTPPTSGAAIAIGLGTLDNGHLIFGGEVQAVDQTYVGTPEASSVYSVTLIDQTFRINKRRPFGTWTNVSASTIARYLVATFAPGFTSSHVADGLPAVSINFDGSQDFMTCMRALATAISDATNTGKTKVDYAQDVWLYLTYSGAQPDPIDRSHPPLNSPSPIRFTVDLSQIRTRVYGKGHGENLLADVGTGEVVLPIADAVMFNAAGGGAIASTTSNGAQTQVLTYAGVQLGGGGSLVGPGQSPSTAPMVAVASGTELGAGAYQHAYTFVTAAGETLPSPLATITTGTTSAPASAPTAGAATAGGSVDAGIQDYEVTFGTSTGETTPSPISNQLTTGAFTVSISAPSTAPTITDSNAPHHAWTAGDQEDIAVTFITATGETTRGPAATIIISAGSVNVSNIPLGPTGTTARRLYRKQYSGTSPTGNIFYTQINDNTSTTFNDLAYSVAETLYSSSGQFGPTSNTATVTENHNTVPLTSIPTGDATVTSRNLYRRFNGAGTFKLLATIADNTTTACSDTTANASLGAAAPSSNTATARRATVTAIAVGPTGTTSRKVYRTVVGASQLKLLTTLADNATTTFADATPDSSLGANAPTGDTSALTQASGQVLAGATSLPTASAGPFNASIGGWAILSGGQVIRYTGISLNTLTGIPASGAGAITTTVLYGTQVLPAPALTGVNKWNGVNLALAKGAAVNIWVQRDDLAAQAALGALELDASGNPSDGIREYLITDDRSTEARMAAVCDADLAIFSRPIIGATYYTRDSKSKSGCTVSIALDVGMFDPAVFDPAVFDVLRTWGQAGTFTIQSVDLTFDGPALNPLYHVTATSVAFTLTDLLRRVALTN